MGRREGAVVSTCMQRAHAELPVHVARRVEHLITQGEEQDARLVGDGSEHFEAVISEDDGSGHVGGVVVVRCMHEE